MSANKIIQTLLLLSLLLRIFLSHSFCNIIIIMAESYVQCYVEFIRPMGCVVGGSENYLYVHKSETRPEQTVTLTQWSEIPTNFTGMNQKKKHAENGSAQCFLSGPYIFRCVICIRNNFCLVDGFVVGVVVYYAVIIVNVYFSLLFPIPIFSFFFQVHFHRMHRLHNS